MKQGIEVALQPLLGLPLWTSRRAADLQGFHFGEGRKVFGRYGDEFVVGTYALHVQCAWRIRNSDRILVGSADLYLAVGDDRDLDPEFEWDRQGANLRDARIDALFGEDAGDRYVVRAVAADNLGGVTIDLGNDIVLEVIPTKSYESENWRLFEPWSEEEHFVVNTEGIEE